MYNIAQFGTFDLENYGDLLFPFILEQSLKGNQNIDKIVLFSPVGGRMPFNSNVEVYPIDKFDELQGIYHFQAIIIGGGDIIRFDRHFAAAEKYNEDNASAKLWIYPALLAEKHGIPLVWNCPGVPFAFTDMEITIVTEILKAVDYISVRDEQSKSLLSSCCSPEKIFVYPDSVLKISSLISKPELTNIHAELEHRISIPDDNYIVFQLSGVVKEDDINIYADTLLKIKQDYALNILLLPIGYVHDDLEILTKINHCYPESFVLIRQKLTPREMLSVIACSRFFIGSSLHGNISAFTYKINSIAINYANLTKVNGFFETIGAEKSQIQSSSELYECFTQTWNKPILDPQEFIQQVEMHISNMDDKIVEGKLTDKNILYELSLQLYEFDYLYNKVVLEKNSEIEILHQEIANQKQQLEQQQQQLEKKHYEVSQWEASFYAINNSTSWKMTKPLRQVVSVFKRILRTGRITRKFYKGLAYLKYHGVQATYSKVTKSTAEENSFKKYYKTHIISKKKLEDEKNTKFDKNIKISILVPLYNTPKIYLIEMIQSVQKQTYGNWELCLADGSDEKHLYVEKICKKLSQGDARIIYKKLEKNQGISENTNRCIDMSTGDYIGLLDHDDILNLSALYEVMKAICEKGADFIYTDEATFVGNKIDNITSIHFKPDYAIDNLRANNYICHFTCFNKNLLDKAGVFRSEYDGSQDHDFVLRLTHIAERVVHIPMVLYYWRSHKNSVAFDINSKSYAIDAGKKAVLYNIRQNGLDAIVESSKVFPTIYRIRYNLLESPLISIIIPNKDHIDDLKVCIDSIVNKSTYNKYEIIIVENNSELKETFDYYITLEKKSNIKVVKWQGIFNYSAINNYAVQYANGENLLFLNNDVEIINSDWLEEMLMYAQRSDVGAVGAKLYYPDNTIQHAGIGIGLLGLAAHYHRYVPTSNPGYMGRLSYAQDVSAVTGACLMMRKDVFEKIKGFDESFEVAFNDVDLCMRIRQKGYLIAFTPYAELYHYESKSRGYDDAPEKKKRFESEVCRFKHRWSKELAAGDPYYNPNLRLDSETFSVKI